MKRKVIVTKLIAEGISERTLSGMTDKQLGIMISRLLPEQYTSNVQSPVNVSKTDANTINSLKQQKKPFATYEGEMKEDFKSDKEGDKAAVIKRLKFKIEHDKNEDKVKVYKRELERLEGKKKDVNEIKNWVNKLVESKVYPFTSKNEIMSLIQIKMNEQTETMAPMPKTKPTKGHNGIPEFMTYDEIKNAEVAEPTIKPTTKPGTKPGVTPTKRPNPYQPGPGINPTPKAVKK